MAQDSASTAQSGSAGSVVLRPATAADSAEVREVVFAALAEFGLAPEPAGADADLLDVRASYSARGGRFDVLVENAARPRILGSVGLYPVDFQTVELRKMYLRRDARGRGLGKRLLEHAIDSARRMGFARITLETASVLAEAIAMYQRRGFLPVARAHIHTARCDLVMAMDLGPDPLAGTGRGVRAETPADHATVDALTRAAFGGEREVGMVQRLRGRGTLVRSLVATEQDRVVAHAMLTPVTVSTDHSSFTAAALGPVAVHPAHQRRAIGSALIRTGLRQLAGAGETIVFVLGHPWYYPRFGFAPARPRGVPWEQPVPDEVFMVLELSPGALAGRSGVVRYLPDFAGA